MSSLNHYWGKAMRPLEYAWRTGQLTESMAAQHGTTQAAVQAQAERYQWSRVQAAATPQEVAPYHNLIAHSMDVAACAAEYLQHHPALEQAIADTLGVTPETARRYVLFWVALHDVGKFGQGFQQLRADLFEPLGRGPVQYAVPYSERHDQVGYDLLEDGVIFESLSDEIHWDVQRPIYSAVTGHHGQPPKPAGAVLLNNQYTNDDLEAVITFMQALWALWIADDPAAVALFESMSESRLKPLSWLVAGLTILADWLGSNTRFFPYVTALGERALDGTKPAGREPEDDPLAAIRHYWTQYAQPQAARAMQATGAQPASLITEEPVAAIFGHLGGTDASITLTPLQHWALETQPTEPTLYLLEDTMGAGKTEAALLLAVRLMQATGAGGIFVAMPTMATANAMYDRVAGVYQALFGEAASLVLSHGKARLHQGFQQSIIRSSTVHTPNVATKSTEAATPNGATTPLDSIRPSSASGAKDVLPHDATHDELPAVIDEQSASARCTAWLADQHKKHLLAPIGVGTVDQVLLGVLPSKHQSLRLLGLFGKVLIVDEAHAGDAYMHKLLEQVLRFHAAFGGSAIILSATLPAEQRQSLIDAYQKGRMQAQGIPFAEQSRLVPDQMAYPLATTYSLSHGVSEIPIAPRRETVRQVPIGVVEDLDQVMALIEQALTRGQSVVWIRNTVTEVIQTAQTLREWLPEVGLGHVEPLVLHARMTLQDRHDHEATLLAWLGKDSTPTDRQQRLVIASQVAEMSLDFDADVLISDLSPIDSVMQRAGRLGRHTRDAAGQRMLTPNAVDQRSALKLWIYAPAWCETPSSSWYASWSKPAAMVYPDHGRLWATLRLLRERDHLNLPMDVRALVEAVYSQDEATLPDGLQGKTDDADMNELSQKSIAQISMLPLQKGYYRENSAWMSEISAVTRLGEPAIEALLLKATPATDHQPATVTPYHEALPPAFSVLRLRQALLPEILDPKTGLCPAPYQAALQAWREAHENTVRWLVPIVLESAASGQWHHDFVHRNNRTCRFEYRSRDGGRIFQQNSVSIDASDLTADQTTDARPLSPRL